MRRDRVARRHLQPDLFVHGASKTLGHHLAVLKHAAWKAPQAAQQPGGGALNEQIAACIIQDDRSRSIVMWRTSPGPLNRALSLNPAFVRQAHGGNRARSTIGFVGRADQRAQLHQPFVQIARRVLRCGHHQLGRELPKLPLSRRLSRISGNVVHTAQHATHIAVEHGLALPECQAEDGAGCVAADPRQRQQRLLLARNRPVMPSHDLLRHPLQIARAGVVAKTCPDPQNVIRRCCRQARYIGKRVIQRSKYGTTVATCVCCSITSEIQTA